MFKVTVFFGCLVALAISAHVQTGMYKKVEADKEYLMKQKSVLQILTHVHQKTVIPELRELVNNYDMEQIGNMFNDARSVKHLIKLYKNGDLMDNRKIFTPLYKSHAQQAKVVFDVLYSAKDWDTYLKTAVWMRENINYGLFVYAFYSTVLHRPDTQGIVLPPLYEVCPHLFFSDETIQKAYDARMRSATKTEKDAFVFTTTTTGWANTKNPELRTSYLTEDVGLNQYHFFHHVTYPQWLKKDQYGVKNERKGELFYYVHEQILARYKLERHANRMYHMRNFTFEEPHVVAYAPNMRYMNGKSVPPRPENIKLKDFDVADIERVKDIEYRIRDAVDSGFVKGIKGEMIPLTAEKGIEILANLIENTTSSVNPRYYGPMYQHILNLVGHVIDPYHQNNVAPGVLQHFQSMLRDPMFYRLYQRIHKLFMAYKKTLPMYTKEVLQFPGVQIESVEVDKLMTFFETFDIDITNVVGVGKVDDAKMMKIIARQPRLNHKDFTIRVKVNSNQDVKAMVHVYLAPKYDMEGIREMSLAERKEYMIQMDKFPYEIKTGKNVIERSSKDSTITVDDMTSFRVLYKKVEDALQGRSQFYINDKGHESGFPSRLILPKGTKSGTPYIMYVIISPHQMSTSAETVRGFKTFLTCGGDVLCGDSYPMGYPFDRQVLETEYMVPNIFMTDVSIYHKKMEESNSDL